ncbi:hypothetical protein D3C72_1895390 [compost metagenome]
MWSIAPLIATFAAISKGVTLAVIPVFMSGFGPLLVLIVSFFKKEAYWKISKIDILCGATSIFALVLWYITKNPDIAIIFSIVSDLFAAIPTVIKSWKYPETESSEAFIGGLLSAFTSYLAATKLDFASLAFSTYLIIINIILIILIEKKRILKSKHFLNNT